MKKLLLILSLLLVGHSWASIPPVPPTKEKPKKNLSHCEKQRLIKAIKQKKIKQVQKILRTCPDAKALVNVKVDANSLPPLFIAINVHSLDIVKELIKHGADVHYQTPFGKDILIHCLYYGDEKITKYLINNGLGKKDSTITYISNGNQYRHTTLSLILDKSFSSLANQLLEDGINFDYPVSSDENPFIISLSRGLDNITKKMMTKGANINVQIDNEPLLIWAIDHKKWSLVDSIITKKGTDLNILSSDKYTPLMKATISGNKKLVFNLLKIGADPLIQRDGIDSYQLALDNHWLEIAEVLKETTFEENFVTRLSDQKRVAARLRKKLMNKHIEIANQEEMMDIITHNFRENLPNSSFWIKHPGIVARIIRISAKKRYYGALLSVINVILTQKQWSATPGLVQIMMETVNTLGKEGEELMIGVAGEILARDYWSTQHPELIENFIEIAAQHKLTLALDALSKTL